MLGCMYNGRYTPGSNAGSDRQREERRCAQPGIYEAFPQSASLYRLWEASGIQCRGFQPLGHVCGTHNGEGGATLPELRDGPGAGLQSLRQPDKAGGAGNACRRTLAYIHPQHRQPPEKRTGRLMKAASQDKTNCIPRLHIAPPYFVLYITVDV